MMQKQMINLSFLRGNLSPCSGGKGCRWRPAPDSTCWGWPGLLGQALHSPTCFQEAQREGWRPSGQLGSHWQRPLCIQGLAQAGHPGSRAKEGHGYGPITEPHQLWTRPPHPRQHLERDQQDLSLRLA